MTTMPVVPPRPARTKQTPDPIPIHRDPPADPLDRASFARSPLNQLPESLGAAHDPTIHSSTAGLSVSEGSHRPPSVRLPSVGHEGDEYANISKTNRLPEQTRTIAHDLPMHQPTATVSRSTAKSRIQTVTRTHSSDAARSFNLEDQHNDKDGTSSPLRSRPSFNLVPSSAISSAGPSDFEQDEDSGIRVPMYPNAGFVQAPSPAPSTSAPNSTITGGVHESPAKNHHRKHSSRHDIVPPGTYGMRGHGADLRDKFERDWYQKHPEEMEKDLHHVYDPGHEPSQMALSSDDLNRLVHRSNDKGIGMATSREAIGTPSEQVGYKASEHYAHSTSRQQPHIDSALRNTFANTGGVGSVDGQNDGPFYLSPPDRLVGKYIGSGYDPPTENLGPNGGNTPEHGGYIHEKGYGVPILASDELAKSPSGAFMQPAVEPEQEKIGDSYHSCYSENHDHQDRTASESDNGSLLRVTSPKGDDESHPKEIQEFEPLFPDEDNEAASALAATGTKSKLLRPDTLKSQHFPSMDVWEDTPNCLALTATVSTPDIVHTPTQESTDAANTFEHPDVESARKDHLEPSDRARYLSDSTREFAKSKFNQDVADDVQARPGMMARFPSSDVWEDSPDSSHLQTIVGSPQTAPLLESPEILGKTATPGSIPEISRRSSVKQSEGQHPVIPDRPRGGSKSSIGGTSDGAADAEAPSLTFAKTKPSVPSRPAGHQISALKASFMNDLNSRLQKGPTVPKREEPVGEDQAGAEEKAPLTDARKGRAKGPTRRKRADEAAEMAVEAQSESCSLSRPRHLFSLDEKGELSVSSDMDQWEIVEGVSHETETAALDGQVVPAAGASENEKEVQQAG